MKNLTGQVVMDSPRIGVNMVFAVGGSARATRWVGVPGAGGIGVMLSRRRRTAPRDRK
jgi:hypothetical protein